MWGGLEGWEKIKERNLKREVFHTSDKRQMEGLMIDYFLSLFLKRYRKYIDIFSQKDIKDPQPNYEIKRWRTRRFP